MDHFLIFIQFFLVNLMFLELFCDVLHNERMGSDLLTSLRTRHLRGPQRAQRWFRVQAHRRARRGQTGVGGFLSWLLLWAVR